MKAYEGIHFDSTQLHRLVEEEQPNICQIAVMKNEQIIYSDSWNGFTTKDNVHIASVTKSIMALLIGIAMDQKLIKNENQMILDFFPDYIPKRGEKTIQSITLSDVMTMTAPYKFKSEPWTKVCASEDWTKSALDLLGGKSGKVGEFKYTTVGIQILSGIITQVSGITTLEFGNRYLFESLDIVGRIPCFAENKEKHIAFVTSKLPQESCWFGEAKGISAAGFGLCLSAEDLCRIGQMCLNKGKWHNTRIVSEGWIEKISTPYLQCDEKYNNMQYGYLWWVLDDKCYAAVGDSGNVIYVNEEKDVVISVTAAFKPLVIDRVQFIQKYIEPFV